MRLTATDKAIGELNMRKADLSRANDFIELYGEKAVEAISDGIADIDRCIELLQSVGNTAKPKPVKAEKSKTAKKGKKSLPVYEEVEA